MRSDAAYKLAFKRTFDQALFILLVKLSLYVLGFRKCVPLSMRFADFDGVSWHTSHRMQARDIQNAAKIKTSVLVDGGSRNGKLGEREARRSCFPRGVHCFGARCVSAGMSRPGDGPNATPPRTTGRTPASCSSSTTESSDLTPGE